MTRKKIQQGERKSARACVPDRCPAKSKWGSVRGLGHLTPLQLLRHGLFLIAMFTCAGGSIPRRGDSSSLAMFPPEPAKKPGWKISKLSTQELLKQWSRLRDTPGHNDKETKDTAADSEMRGGESIVLTPPTINPHCMPSRQKSYMHSGPLDLEEEECLSHVARNSHLSPADREHEVHCSSSITSHISPVSPM